VQKTAFPAPAAQPQRAVVVEYKPRRRLISNA
jgi:hypothetical protein